MKNYILKETPQTNQGENINLGEGREEISEEEVIRAMSDPAKTYDDVLPMFEKFDEQCMDEAEDNWIMANGDGELLNRERIKYNLKIAHMLERTALYKKEAMDYYLMAWTMANEDTNRDLSFEAMAGKERLEDLT